MNDEREGNELDNNMPKLFSHRLKKTKYESMQCILFHFTPQSKFLIVIIIVAILLRRYVLIFFLRKLLFLSPRVLAYSSPRLSIFPFIGS